MKENVKVLGYCSSIIATILLGSLGIFVRNISASGYVITFARFGMGFIFLMLFLFFSKKFKNIKVSRFSVPLLATGILVGLTSLCYIHAINSTSLSNAVFLLYLGPLIAVGLAAIFLRENFTFFNFGLLCLAFLGFLFILEFKFSFQIAESQGLWWGVGSAICHALYIIFNRKISGEITALTRSFYQLFLGAMTMLPFIGFSIFKLSLIDLCWLTALGFFHGFVAFTLMTLALKHLKAIEFGTIAYVEPLVATFIGFIFYAEKLTLFQSVGCAIILLGGMIQVATSKKGG